MNAPSSVPTASTPKRLSQRARVEAALLQQGQLSAHTATYQMGITRLAAIVHRLKKEGWTIDTRGEGAGMLATYILVEAPQASGPASVVAMKLWSEG